jgi:hypothetical protein
LSMDVVTCLSWRKNKSQRIAQGIDDGMMVWTAPTASIVPD